MNKIFLFSLLLIGQAATAAETSMVFAKCAGRYNVKEIHYSQTDDVPYCFSENFNGYSKTEIKSSEALGTYTQTLSEFGGVNGGPNQISQDAHPAYADRGSIEGEFTGSKDGCESKFSWTESLSGTVYKHSRRWGIRKAGAEITFFDYWTSTSHGKTSYCKISGKIEVDQ